MIFLIVLFRYGLYYTKLEEYGWKKLSIDLNYSFFGNCDMFLVGMIGGHFYCKLRDQSLFKKVFSSKILSMAYVGLMWTFLVKFIDTFDQTSYPLVISTLCVLLILFCSMAFSSGRNTALSRYLSILGGMSFSIYLLHAFVRDALRGTGVEAWLSEVLLNYSVQGEWLSFALAAILYLPVILLVSYFTFENIEKPFLRMRIKY